MKKYKWIGMTKMDINEIYEKIDRLFEENKAKDAEKYMNDMLHQAFEQGDNVLAIYMLNELIGYYRQASMKDELLDVIKQSYEVSKKLNLENTIDYATTLLNIATGYRSIGCLEQAKECYEQTEGIYNVQLEKTDMRYASLYNNQSLLEQELGNYEKALNYQKRALEIALKNDAGFEIAVSYTNLANTYISLKDYKNAYENASLAIDKYIERNVKDPHYCAALGVLGLCSYENGEYETAIGYFTQGMEIIEESIGKNSQYERMKGYYDLCMSQIHPERKQNGELSGNANGTHTASQREQNGMFLCKKYYEEYGLPMLKREFPEYLNKIAVGLVGEGSDCYGFDDAVSRDHDWGPGFCIWVTEDTYAQIGEALEQCYSGLPDEYMGYKRIKTVQGNQRVGVFTISAFYESLLGVKLSGAGDVRNLDYTTLADYSLACATNGEVFEDKEGIFSSIRNALLQGYPERVQYLKLAESMTKYSQTGQYNYNRMWKRGDYLSADRMLVNGIYHGMEVFHYLHNCYVPHDKWVYESTKRMDEDGLFIGYIDKLSGYIGKHDAASNKIICELFEEIGTYLVRELYKKSIISDMNPYLAYHQDELLLKAQYMDFSHEELVDKIARLEFKAFDQVQNEGGRASCQNNWPTFSVMRKSQYLTWNHTMLIQYMYDFTREFSLGHNLITEKYGRMMESTAPERYEEIKENFPPLSEQKKAIIEQIVSVQMSMIEEFAKEHPKVADNARSLHTYEDNFTNTSYETYLRGEISTYSDKMLQLYAAYVIEKATKNENIARQIIENTAKLYGYQSLEEFEAREGGK